MKKLITFVLLFFILTTSFVTAQDYGNGDFEKLHPKFKSVLSKDLAYLNLKYDAPALEHSGVNKKGEKIYTAIVYTGFHSEIMNRGFVINSVYPNFVTMRVTPTEIFQLIKINSVIYIDAPLKMDLHNDVSTSMSGASLLHNGYVMNSVFKGSGVVVAIIDTGIDWTHLDFRNPADNTKSRILYIWDQTLTAQSGENPPSLFSYGVEYTKAQIDDELDGTPPNFVREKDINGHGTHVAGTVCGNGNSLSTKRFTGFAPEADIIIIKTTFDNADIADAYNYLNQKKTALGKPVVVNASLGSNYGPHDGTDVMSTAINSYTGTGKISVVSAGNSGSDNIHYSNSIAAGNYLDVTVTVPAYTASSGTFNDYFLLDTWFDDNSSVNITITSPFNSTTTQNANGSTTNQTNDGTVFINNDIDVNNNDREIDIQIYDADASKPPKNGTWTFRFTNTSGSNVFFHTWLAAYSLGSATPVLTNGNSSYTLGNDAESSLIVGSYVSKWRWESSPGSYYSYSGTDRSDNISSFSSKGPTRDGRQKPDISAPGQGLGSSRSKDVIFNSSIILPGEKHVLMEGTSMSSPSTTGAVALLMQYNPNFTANEIKSIINSTANTDSYTGGSLPDYVWGYGKLDIFKALAKAISSTSDYKHSILSYDQWGNNSYFSLASSQKIAVRFTAPYEGKITGGFLHIDYPAGLTSPFYAEIWSNGSGNLPSAKIGSTSSLDQTKVYKETWNYIDMRNCGVSVTSGNDYHIVVYFTSGTNTDMFRENGSFDSRSSLYNGSSWSAYSYDVRLRPEITTDETTLPVELVSFTSSVENNTVTLKWVTDKEVNNAGFYIERQNTATISSEWFERGFVKGNGNTNSTTEYKFTDNNLPVSKYNYRLKQIDFNGNFGYHALSNVVEIGLPAKHELSQNYPNPFNPATKIDFSLPLDSKVSIKLYDMTGREVKTLVNDARTAGYYTVQFNASGMASGIYFYRIMTKSSGSDYIMTKKMVLIK